jgi:hypothetical protein
LILRSEKNEAVAHYALGNLHNKVLSSQYKLALPDEKELAEEIAKTRKALLFFEQILIEVWRQTLVENAKVVELWADRFPVKDTPKRRLRQADFVFDGNEIRGL